MFYLLNSNRNSFNNLFDDFFDFSIPKTEKHSNVEKTENEFILTTTLPGFKKEEIQISTENNILKISAKCNKKLNWLKEEYNQSYSLEDNIDTEKISAKLEDGILIITLPIKEKVKPKTINIQ
jgi:HSP20 family protein